MVEMQASDIARKWDLQLIGDGSQTVKQVSPLEEAEPSSLVFLEHERFLNKLEKCPAKVVLAPASLADKIPHTGTLLLSHDVKNSLIDILNDFYPQEIPSPGIDPSAIIETGATVSPKAYIGPLCHISADTVVETGACLYSSVFIGPRCRVGANCTLHPGVVLRRHVILGKSVEIHANSVLGEDGFGYHQGKTGIRKIPQIGGVKVEDDVEIGASVTIDRGALGTTTIGQGTKIDNLVQIAHNVDIGKNNMIIAQVGISGSVRVGNGCILAGQVGVADHAVIEDGAIAAAQAGVSQRGIKKGQAVLGSPARPIQDEKRIWSSLGKLPDMMKELRKIKKEMDNN